MNRNAEESEYLLSWSCNAGIREAIQKFGQSAAGQERYRLTQMVKETAKPDGEGNGQARGFNQDSKSLYWYVLSYQE